MNMELNEKEKETLSSVLEKYLFELRGEIASGVKHDMKEKLKEEQEILNRILEKVKAAVEYTSGAKL
jgi:hypothetical protein